ncbi:hypothetical protein THAOC_29485, partial [Thalassiosira oceanica]
MEVAEGCNPDQNRPPFTILASTEAVDPGIADDFGLEVERCSTPRNYTARGTPPFESTKRQSIAVVETLTGFKKRQFSNGDLRPAESQRKGEEGEVRLGMECARGAAKRRRVSTVESALASIDVLGHLAAFLEAGELCHVRATCKALGSRDDSAIDGLSMTEEAARWIFESASDEEKAMLPRHDGEGWIEL